MRPTSLQYLWMYAVLIVVVITLYYIFDTISKQYSSKNCRDVIFMCLFSTYQCNYSMQYVVRMWHHGKPAVKLNETKALDYSHAGMFHAEGIFGVETPCTGPALGLTPAGSIH